MNILTEENILKPFWVQYDKDNDYFLTIKERIKDKKISVSLSHEQWSFLVGHIADLDDSAAEVIQTKLNKAYSVELHKIKQQNERYQ